MPEPAIDPLRYDEAIQGFRSGLTREKIREEFITKGLGSEEQADHVLDAAETVMQQASIPSPEVKPDLGLFGSGDAYDKMKTDVEKIDADIAELDFQIRDKSSTAKYPGDQQHQITQQQKLDLIKQKEQLQTDKDSILGERGRAIREIVARTKEAGTFYWTDDGPESLNYEHSNEYKFLVAATDYLNQWDSSLEAELRDGQIYVKQGNQYVVVEPDFMDTLIAQRYEVGGALGVGIPATIAGMRFLGPKGAIASSVLGSMIGAGAGTAKDTIDTLELIGQETEPMYLAQKALDAASFDALGGAVGTGVGKAGALVGKKAWGFLFGGKNSELSDKGYQRLLAETGLTEEQLKENTTEWLKTVPEGARIKIQDFTDLKVVKREAGSEVKFVHNVKGHASLTERDQQLLYLLETHPDSTHIIRHLIAHDKLFNSRLSLDNAISRGDQVKNMINEGEDFIPSEIISSLKDYRRDLQSAMREFGKYLGYKKKTDMFSGTKKLQPKELTPGDVLNFYEPTGLAQKHGARYRSLRNSPLMVDFYTQLREQFSTTNMSGDRFINFYNDFLIETANRQGNRVPDFGPLNKLTQEFIEKQFDDIVAEQELKPSKVFGVLMKQYDQYNTLTGNAMFRELNNPKFDLNPDSVAEVLLKYSGHANPGLYKQVLKAIEDLPASRQELKKQRFMSVEHAPETKIRENKSLERVINRYHKTLEGSKGARFNAIESLEMGVMKYLAQKHSVSIGGPRGSQHIIDFVGMGKDLDGVAFQKGSKAETGLQYIDAMSKVYLNDVGILAAVRGAKTPLNLDSGSSIATTIEGKFKVQFATFGYDKILSQFPDTKQGQVKAILDPVIKILSGDKPIKARDYKDVVDAFNKAGVN